MFSLYQLCFYKEKYFGDHPMTFRVWIPYIYINFVCVLQIVDRHKLFLLWIFQTLFMEYNVTH